MRIVEVCDDSGIENFVRFPFRLYSRKSLWVPPIKSDVRSALDKEKHPFYEDKDSDAQCFLAKEEKETVGRIMALESGGYNRDHAENTAFFYFFESINDRKVAARLFGASFQWAQERELDTIMGPMGMLAGGGHGILVEGFDKRPGMNMTWNPPYYSELLEEAGFYKKMDSRSAQVDLDYEEKEVEIKKLRRTAKKVREKLNFKIRTFSNKQEVEADMGRLVPELTNLYNESFKPLPLYHPMDESKMRRIINQLLSITDSRSIRLVKLVLRDEKVVGFLLAYPNVARGLRKARGRIWPLGWFHLWRDRRYTKWFDVNGIGVLPRYQGRGVAILLYTELLRSLQESRFEHMIVNQVSEDNYKNVREMKKTLGIKFDRTHRIYECKV